MLNLAHDQDVGSASKNRIASLEEQVQVLTKKLKDLGAAAKAKVRQKKEKKKKKEKRKKRKRLVIVTVITHAFPPKNKALVTTPDYTYTQIVTHTQLTMPTIVPTGGGPAVADGRDREETQ